LLGTLAALGHGIAEVPVRPVYADEVSRLRWRHLPVIAGVVARVWLRRVLLVPYASTRSEALATRVLPKPGRAGK
jgi:hypothetical protein